MVVRDAIVYNYKDAVWAQMPNKNHFKIFTAEADLLPEQAEFIDDFSGLLLNADEIEQSTLSAGIELLFTDSALTIKVSAGVERLDVCFVNTSRKINIEFAVDSDCLIVSHIFNSSKEHSVFNNWHLCENAKVKHVLHIYGGAAPINVHHAIQQATNTSFNGWRVVHSGSWLHEHTQCYLSGINAAASIKSLVLALPDNHCQSGARFEHIAPKTSSKHLVNMLVADAARGVCFSDVEVKANASEVYSEQYNKNLALGPTAEIFTQPRLCINNDNVICSHGATTGQLELDKLNYLCARGLSILQAKQLLIKAYANTIMCDSPDADWSSGILRKFWG